MISTVHNAKFVCTDKKDREVGDVKKPPVFLKNLIPPSELDIRNFFIKE
jgi:hypothetical protein